MHDLNLQIRQVFSVFLLLRRKKRLMSEYYFLKNKKTVSRPLWFMHLFDNKE